MGLQDGSGFEGQRIILPGDFGGTSGGGRSFVFHNGRWIAEAGALKNRDDKYTSKFGGGAPAPASSPKPPTTPPSNTGDSLGGLQSLVTPSAHRPTGMDLAGGGASAASVPAVGGLTGAGAVDSDSLPPSPPSGDMSLPGGGGGEQYLTGPMAARQGLGRRIPPSLAGLLKPKVY